MEGLERPEPHGGIVPLMGLEVQSPEARRKAKEEVAEAKETTEKSRGPKKRLQNVFTRMEGRGFRYLCGWVGGASFVSWNGDFLSQT